VHLLLSLFYLLLVAFLVFGYVAIFIISFRYILLLLQNILKRNWSQKAFLPTKSILFKRSQLLVLNLVCIALTCGLFIFERNRWITPNSAYPDAKNYMVVGMVLLEYRTIGVSFMYPERLIWKPAEWMQHLISKTGQSLIPESDGEHAIWQYYFVLAPYVNRLHAPRTREVHRLIDTAEYVLETLAEKEIKDEVFRDDKQYSIYPLVSLFYVYSYCGRYFLVPQTKCYYEGLYKDPAQAAKLKQIVDWSIIKEKKWAENAPVRRFIQDHPNIELVQIASVAILLQEILRYQIHNLEFACDDKHVNLYYEYVNRYVAEDSPSRRVDSKMRKRFNNPIIGHGYNINFFGHRLCNFKKLPNYSISKAEYLKSEAPGWYNAFLELNKRLVPPAKQREVLERTDKRE
jgi:hypothetical protein